MINVRKYLFWNTCFYKINNQCGLYKFFLGGGQNGDYGNLGKGEIMQWGGELEPFWALGGGVEHASLDGLTPL